LTLSGEEEISKNSQRLFCDASCCEKREESPQGMLVRGKKFKKGKKGKSGL